MRLTLGRVVITSNALATLHPEDVLTCLRRHERGDWGDELCKEDRDSNDYAVGQLLRVLSKYRDRNGNDMYIITEHDRSVTTILRCEDY